MFSSDQNVNQKVLIKDKPQKQKRAIYRAIKLLISGGEKKQKKKKLM